MLLKVALPNGRVGLYRAELERNPVGFRALVPLKEGATTGVVVGVAYEGDSEKRVIEFPDKAPIVKEHHLDILKELAPYHLTQPYRLLFKLLPSNFVWRKKGFVYPRRKDTLGLDSFTKGVIEYLLKRRRVGLGTFVRKFSKEVLEALRKKGILEVRQEWDIPKVSTRVFSLRLPLQEALRRVRSEEKKKLILLAYSSLGVSEEELREKGFRVSQATELVRRGILTEELTYPATLRFPLRLKQEVAEGRSFYRYQLAEGELDFLIKKIIERAERSLSEGRSVLVLVPRLRDLLQLKDILSESLGDRVLEVSSRLSPKAMYDTWFTAAGSACVVVGSFLASLIPFDSLGEVVLFDEATKGVRLEHAFGLDMRNVAYLLARKADAGLMLASAVASVHSRRLVVAGELKEERSFRERGIRVFRRSPSEIISEGLAEYIAENSDREILFLARKRGYSYMFCPRCGFIAECPACSTLMTYSMFMERFYCSKCGYRREELSCPECEGSLKPVGFGIERVIKVLEQSFGRRKNFHFSNTPDATDSKDIVVVVSADNILSVPSYSSDEEFFQYLWRAFLNSRKELVVQSVFPHHEAIRSLESLRPELFTDEELRRREREHLPPFWRLYLIEASRSLEEEIRDRVSEEVLSVFKEGRWHHLVKIRRENKEAVLRLNELVREFSKMVKVSLEG